jgi:hypothetical protein
VACIHAEEQAKAEQVADMQRDASDVQRQLATASATEARGLRQELQFDRETLSALAREGTYVPVKSDVCVPTHLASSFVGGSERDALTTADKVRLTVRIVERDGKTFPINPDVVTNRLNLSVSHGVVKSASIG